MVAYQTESDLLTLLRRHYARGGDEGRTLLHELRHAAADIDVTEIQIKICPLSSPHSTLAVQALCEPSPRPKQSSQDLVLRCASPSTAADRTSLSYTTAQTDDSARPIFRHLKPDIPVIHAQKADRNGNVLLSCPSSWNMPKRYRAFCRWIQDQLGRSDHEFGMRLTQLCSLGLHADVPGIHEKPFGHCLLNFMPARAATGVLLFIEPLHKIYYK
jgi:hypothetical protein